MQHGAWRRWRAGAAGLALGLSLAGGCPDPLVIPEPDYVPPGEEIPDGPIGRPDGEGTCFLPAEWHEDGARCRSVRVSCPGFDPAMAELIVWPAFGRTYGTVVLSSAGFGDAFFGEVDGVVPWIRRMRNAGYQVVDRRWVDGWFGASAPGAGLAAPACRFGTLLQWVHDEIHERGALCAAGSAEGASEIAYGLTRYGAGDLLRAVVLSGGPAAARLDLGCLDAIVDRGWRDECALVSVNLQQRCGGSAPVCAFNDRPGAAGPRRIDQAFADARNDAPCTGDGFGGDLRFLDAFTADSLVGPQSVLDYPKTDLALIVGGSDCTEGVTLGQHYLNAVTSDRTILLVPNVPNAIERSPEGLDALGVALLQRCVDGP